MLILSGFYYQLYLDRLWLKPQFISKDKMQNITQNLRKEVSSKAKKDCSLTKVVANCEQRSLVGSFAGLSLTLFAVIKYSGQALRIKIKSFEIIKIYLYSVLNLDVDITRWSLNQETREEVVLVYWPLSFDWVCQHLSQDFSTKRKFGLGPPRTCSSLVLVSCNTVNFGFSISASKSASGSTLSTDNKDIHPMATDMLFYPLLEVPS